MDIDLEFILFQEDIRFPKPVKEKWAHTRFKAGSFMILS